jgi:ATP-dependent DNA ligase
LNGMPSAFIPPCIPTRAYKVPVGPDWVHEIKHDGYRLQVRRYGDTVRPFTRRGYDWTGRYPAIVATARQLRAPAPLTLHALFAQAVVYKKARHGPNFGKGEIHAEVRSVGGACQRGLVDGCWPTQSG